MLGIRRRIQEIIEEHRRCIQENVRKSKPTKRFLSNIFEKIILHDDLSSSFLTYLVLIKKVDSLVK